MARQLKGFRLTEDQDKKLNEIAEVMRMSRTEVVGNLITAEYDKIHDNHDLKKMIDSLRSIQDQIENFVK